MDVLLIEDNEDDIWLMRESIEASGRKTNLTVVRDGESALAWLRENKDNPPHLVFLDLSIPRISGLDLLQRLQEDPDLRGLFLVVLTGFLPPRKLAEVAAIGPYPCHKKPPTSDEYKNLVSLALEYWESIER